MAATITLTDEDIIRLQMVLVGHDAGEVLTFIRERLVPLVKGAGEDDDQPFGRQRLDVLTA